MFLKERTSSERFIRDRVLINILINVDRYSAISVTRVNDIGGAIVRFVSIPAFVSDRSPYLFLSFQPSLPFLFPVFPFLIITFLSRSFLCARARFRSPFLYDRLDLGLSLSLSISPLPPPRACVRVGAWIGGWIGERTYAETRTRSPLLASAARSFSVRASRGHREVLVSKPIEQLRGTRSLRQPEKKKKKKKKKRSTDKKERKKRNWIWGRRNERERETREENLRTKRERKRQRKRERGEEQVDEEEE